MCNAAAPAVDSSSKRKEHTSRRKSRMETPEGLLRLNLNMCSKHGDLPEALRLYEQALVDSIPLCQYHYNVLLYLCSFSSSATSSTSQEMRPVESVPLGSRLDKGIEIFRRMEIEKIVPNEATFTSLARLAAEKEDPDLAFELIKKMHISGIPPKLRSYGPALFGFCSKGNAEKAYQVEDHMAKCGVLPEDSEIAALIRVSSTTKRGDQVYRLLQKLRALVRQVSDSTAEDVESWFKSDAAEVVGMERWDVRKVKEGVKKGGGGWHGQGWLGKGKWNVGRTLIDDNGVCCRCGQSLMSIDIDPLETENFAKSMSKFACRNETKANFFRFQDWLSRNGPYDAVIDGANVGLYKQAKFSFSQINNIVKGIQKLGPSKKMPLIILHSRRLKGDHADTPYNKNLIENWQKSGMLYATPTGSNDDWYWLYAAVSCKSLVITNDEMRDHLFQLLGNSFFPRWKEKHQVRLSLSRRGPKFHMPPPYSTVIQESETGSWHFPTTGTGDEVETPRQWICATRFAVNTKSVPQTQPERPRLSSIFLEQESSDAHRDLGNCL